LKDILLVDGIHEGLVSEEVWEQAQIKRKDMANKYKRYNRTVETVVLLSKER
jgi:site-specific DNA recombinase